VVRDTCKGVERANHGRIWRRATKPRAPRLVQRRRRVGTSTGGGAGSACRGAVKDWVPAAHRSQHRWRLHGFSRRSAADSPQRTDAAMAIAFGEGKPGRRAGQIKEKQGNLAAARWWKEGIWRWFWRPWAGIRGWFWRPRAGGEKGNGPGPKLGEIFHLARPFFWTFQQVGLEEHCWNNKARFTWAIVELFFCERQHWNRKNGRLFT
jgi:hypothetical protein